MKLFEWNVANWMAQKLTKQKLIFGMDFWRLVTANSTHSSIQQAPLYTFNNRNRYKVCTYYILYFLLPTNYSKILYCTGVGDLWTWAHTQFNYFVKSTQGLQVFSHSLFFPSLSNSLAPCTDIYVYSWIGVFELLPYTYRMCNMDLKMKRKVGKNIIIIRRLHEVYNKKMPIHPHAYIESGDATTMECL